MCAYRPDIATLCIEGADSPACKGQAFHLRYSAWLYVEEALVDNDDDHDESIDQPDSRKTCVVSTWDVSGREV